jgi:hypothetical protein
MAIRRRRYGTGHAYYVDDVKVPGVTSILKMLPNDKLVGWAGRATAEYALDNWDQLAAMSPSQRLRTLEKARYQARDAAARRGTQVHALAEKLVAGEAVPVPDALAGHVEAYRDWLDATEAVPVATELVVCHRALRYCGTADLIADLPPLLVDTELLPAARWLLELKTTASGVWPESALQATAYSRAEVFIDPAAPDDERYMEWLGIERAGVVWIKSDACQLRPVDTSDDTWEFFKYLRWLHEHQADMDGWIGSPAAVASPELAAMT